MLNSEVRIMNIREFGIYDGSGVFIRPATERDFYFEEEGQYRVPLRIPSASSLSKTVFDSFKLTSYQSLTFLSDYRSNNTLGAFLVNLRGVVSNSDRSIINYQLLIDSRSFSETPQVYVLSPNCENILHENIFEKGRYSILPQKEICGLCLGVRFSEVYNECSSEKEKLGFLLHHIEDVLNNPNPDDSARTR